MVRSSLSPAATSDTKKPRQYQQKHQDIKVPFRISNRNTKHRDGAKLCLCFFVCLFFMMQKILGIHYPGMDFHGRQNLEKL